MLNWTEIIDSWLEKNRSYQEMRDDVISLFQVALENTSIPEKSWFGFPLTKGRLSIMFGRIYLIGIFDKTIEIIVDVDLNKETGFDTRIVGTSKPSGLNLYWISTDFSNIKKLISNEKIWEHYRIASQKVDNSKSIRSERKDLLTGKFLVKDIFNDQIKKDIEKNVKIQLQLALEKLNKEMLKIIPEKRLAEIEQTLRKDKRIIELLKKSANYKCQFPNCNSEILTKKGINYVEVAHINAVHKGGQSIIGNLIVLCPNHHKEFDYGNLEIIEQSESLLNGVLNGKAFSITHITEN